MAGGASPGADRRGQAIRETPVRVIVAEPDERTLPLLLDALSGTGHVCRQASDGLQAWRLVEARVPDVLIAHWDLPGLDGLALCQRIRHQYPGDRPYVIVSTERQRRGDARAAMQAGVDDLLGRPIELQELECRLFVAERVSALRRELTARGDELECLRRELVENTRRDPLTGTGSRVQLFEDADTLNGRLRRYGHRCTLALIDIDGFRSYNGVHGSVAGDRVLADVADLLVTQTRSGDSVYRYGGDEFLAVFAEQTADEAMAAVGRLRDAVKQGVTSPGRVLTLSVGIAEAGSGAGGGFHAALRRAGVALQEAKQTGRDRVVIAPDAPAADR